MKPQNLTKGIIAIVAALFVMNSLALGQWTLSGNKVYTTNDDYHVGIGTGSTMSALKKLEVKHTYVTSYPTYGIYVDIKNTRGDTGVYGTYILAQTDDANGDGNVYGTFIKAISTDESGDVYGGYFEAAATGDNYHSYGLYVNGGTAGPLYHYGIYVDNGKKNYFEKPVGIGTTNLGSYQLAVNGKIRAKEVVVETGWSDFVFETDYDLRPLAEVAEYIKANKQLPNMPSAAEVSKNGVSLGKMQATLLQKVEELTLYVIELKKENEALKARVAELER